VVVGQTTLYSSGHIRYKHINYSAQVNVRMIRKGAGKCLPFQSTWVHPLVFSGIRVTRSLVLCVMCCRSLFVPLSYFFWPFCYLSFNLRILTTPLVSSTSFVYRYFKGQFKKGCILTIVLFLFQCEQNRRKGWTGPKSVIKCFHGKCFK
jgi:hypothetical protein